MHDTEPDRPASGSIPQTFRLRLGWQWVPQMPLQLRRRKAFLFALATLAGMADQAGRTRFQDSGQAIRIPRLAAAMGSREKDCRRYLAAAIAAGILTTEAPPRRGRTTVYVLQLPPAAPRWAAALSVLDAGETPATAGGEHDRTPAEFGPPAPELDDAVQPTSSGVGGPNSTPVTPGQVRATDARPSSGYGRPLSSGYGPPNNPGVPMDTPHEMVAAVPQVLDARGDDSHERAHDPSPPPGPPPLHAVPPPPGTRTRPAASAVGDRQPPLLVSVPQPDRPAQSPAHPPEYAETDHTPPGRHAAAQPFGSPRVPWRALVASERPDAAARVYRERWTGGHAAYLPDPTGT